MITNRKTTTTKGARKEFEALESPAEALRSTKFRPRSRRQQYLVDAFQAPIDPLHDSIHLGNNPGIIIEHTHFGDFRSGFGFVRRKYEVKGIRERIALLEAKIIELKAANEILTRFEREKSDSRLRLLRALRGSMSEVILKELAKSSPIPVEQLASNMESTELLVELGRSGHIEIHNSLVSATEAGKQFFQRCVGLADSNVT